MTTPSSKKFEPGVQKFLDEEESKEIIQEYKSTTVNLGYKKSRLRFPEIKLKPITTFSPEIWRKFNMDNFDFVKLAVEAGCATPSGNLIIDATATTTVKKLALLALLNIKAVKIMTKSLINPKSNIKVDGSKYLFGSGDLKNFILHHFPKDEEQIKAVNSTDLLKSLIAMIEKNPTRQRLPLHILSIFDESKKKKIYCLDSIFTLLTFDQAVRLTTGTKKKPHYTMDEATSLFTKLVTKDVKETEKVSDIPLVSSVPQEDKIDFNPELHEDIERDTDESLPPAIEIAPEKPDNVVVVDKVINLSALKKILGRGDTIKITIEYTRSSGE